MSSVLCFIFYMLCVVRLRYNAKSTSRCRRDFIIQHEGGGITLKEGTEKLGKHEGEGYPDPEGRIKNPSEKQKGCVVYVMWR